jgi:ADP-heptose:LPS heptosyltransferase
MLLTVVRRLFDFFARQADEPSQRILFVKLVEQGSTVLASSTIRRAIGMVGQKNVYFLVFEDNRFILDAMGLIAPENVFTIRSDRISASVGDAFQAIHLMRKMRIDTAIDLEFYARSSAALSFLSGARFRVGFHAFGGEGPYRGDLMTHRLRFNPHLHTSQTFRMMVEALSVCADGLPTLDMLPIPADEVPPRFEPGPGEVEQARALLRLAAGTERIGRLILLNANCSDLLPLRRWPVERYIELARRLISHYPEVCVAMTGSPSEAAVAAALVDQVGSDRCFNLSGRTTLRQLLVIYGLAEVWLPTTVVRRTLRR